jgi:hypothetical protein
VEEKLPLPEKPFIKPWMIDRADDNYELSGDKARNLIGWSPKYTLRDTLPKILEGLKVDPEKWYKINKLHWSGHGSGSGNGSGHGHEHSAPQIEAHSVKNPAGIVDQIEHQAHTELLDPPGPAPALITQNPNTDEQRSHEAS